MRWRRLLGPEVFLRGDDLVEEALWRDFTMPIANIVTAGHTWIPNAGFKLYVESGVGNRLDIADDESTLELRRRVGEHLRAINRHRRLSNRTRAALLID